MSGELPTPPPGSPGQSGYDDSASPSDDDQNQNPTASSDHAYSMEDMFFPGDNTQAQAKTVMSGAERARRRYGDPANVEQPQALPSIEKLFESWTQDPQKLAEFLKQPENQNLLERWGGSDTHSGKNWDLLVWPTPIQQGGMSEIYLGYDLAEGRTVALKTISRRSLYDANRLGYFSLGDPTLPAQNLRNPIDEFYANATMREYKILSLTQGNRDIVETSGIFQHQRLPQPGVPESEQLGAGVQDVLVLQYYSPEKYMTGDEFRDIAVADPQQAWFTLMDTLPEWAGALDNLWFNDKILHQDIKPSNVLFPRPGANTPEGIVILDFGTSTKLNDPNFKPAEGGTPRFSPPERGKEDPYYEPIQGEVYSLAATILSLWDLGFVVNKEWNASDLEKFCDQVNRAIAVREDLSAKFKAQCKIDSRKFVRAFETALSETPEHRQRDLFTFLKDLASSSEIYAYQE